MTDALNADQRGGIGYNGKTSLTVAAAAAQLTRDGLSWSQTLGQPTTVTYAFRATGPAQMPDDTAGFSTFTSEQIVAAELALQRWAQVANITFVRVGTGQQGSAAYSDAATILFGNYASGEQGASAFTYLPGNRSAASFSGDVWVNASIASNQHPSDTGSIGLETLVHEIGHAIGLSHPSDYDAGASVPTYSNAASYFEDSEEYSIMSYFGLRNTGGVSSLSGPGGPLIDDVAAAQRLYGANLSTATGNTLYGYVGGAQGVYASYLQAPQASSNTSLLTTNIQTHLYGTIWDGGGIDTISASNATSMVKIDLHSGAFSNIGGDTGTLSIAVGAVIENAVGGSSYDTLIGNDVANVLIGNGGNDTLIGNGGDDILIGGAAADTMTGGAGADTFIGLLSEFHGDTITDLGVGDHIRFTDGVLATFKYQLVMGIAGLAMAYDDSPDNSNAVAYAGILTFANLNTAAKFTISTSPQGGVDLSLYGTSLAAVRLDHDFNGDGRSDILWRNDNGQLGDWFGNANGSFTINTSLSVAPLDWKIAGTGDFNGDGRSDVLWRNSVTGQLGDWVADANGNLTALPKLYSVSGDWKIAGTGDFNGDGRSDILWRNSVTGQLGDWVADANGNLAALPTLYSVSGDWKIAGTGDFNGDGRSDILWRNSATGQLGDWIADASGNFSALPTLYGVGGDWKIAGTGDFNGDGRADILWRNDNGQLGDWLGNANGGFTPNATLYGVGNEWAVVDTGDYNGDGRADILWRNANGQLGDWLANADGSFAPNPTLYSVANEWKVQPTHDYLG